MNLLSDEVILQINQLNRVQVQIWLLQYSFSIFPIPASWRVFYII